MYVHIPIHIYIYREREKERDLLMYIERHRFIDPQTKIAFYAARGVACCLWTILIAIILLVIIIASLLLAVNTAIRLMQGYRIVHTAIPATGLGNQTQDYPSPPPRDTALWKKSVLIWFNN